MALIIKCSNNLVTDYYLELVGRSLSDNDLFVQYTNDIRDAYSLNKDELIVVARLLDAFKLILKRYKRVIIWFQGVEPEESFLIHKSRMRLLLLNAIERLVFKNTVFHLFVSDEMKKHFDIKYNTINRRIPSFVMPCFNTDLNKEAFEPTDKYINNVFSYIGSLAEWQKYDETIKLYKTIEESGLPNCELWVLTKEIEKATRIIEKYHVSNYKVDFIGNDELSSYLGRAKYGFIIRDDNVVNQVATPTKISTYLSCGIIPIYSKCLKDFDAIASSMRFKICMDDDVLEQLFIFEASSISNQEILSEYESVFNKYYNGIYYQKLLTSHFKNFLSE